MLPTEILSKNILISPLNWGMGHVARCIPLIDMFLKQNNTVFIACSKDQKEIFEFYFNQLEVTYINHNGYPFKFRGKGRFWLDMIASFRRLSKRKSIELNEVESLVSQNNIDFVISDHRYGFFTKKCTSIFMTHQLNLPVKGLFKLVQKLHEKEFRKFDFIWVLDDEESTFAGNLSRHSNNINVLYIGLLSRFSLYPKKTKIHPVVVIVSGPEPYAEHFFKEQLSLAINRKMETIIISPKIYLNNINNSKIKVFCSENWLDKDEVIMRAKKIISRSGYSTIMDVLILKSDFEFVPTKGQAEQIYLSELYHN